MLIGGHDAGSQARWWEKPRQAGCFAAPVGKAGVVICDNETSLSCSYTYRPPYFDVLPTLAANSLMPPNSSHLVLILLAMLAFVIIGLAGPAMSTRMVLPKSMGNFSVGLCILVAGSESSSW
ncbi:MAG: hypothetical protein KDA91_19550 [Planctomycetaceae bacterium]|nr:hypothetical protein [Planctomycetaceae bacterium]